MGEGINSGVTFAGGAIGQVIPVTQTAIPTTGQTVVVSNSGQPNITLLVTPAGTLLALTVTLPSAPFDGQKVKILSSQILTGLTVGGGTIVGAATSSVLGGFSEYQWNQANSIWYRCG